MRFVVYGAGAVGGVVGARLAQHGHDVVLLARGEQYEALRARGIRLESAADSVTLAVPVVDHPARIEWGADDVVLLAMKSQDTAAALEQLAAAAPAKTAVVCLQNGVDNERMALRHFANVYGICVMCPTGFLTPGVVQAWSTPVTGILDVGRYPSGVDDIAQRVAAALRASTFLAEVRADVMRWKYGKLLMNLGNAVEALCGPAARTSAIAAAARREGEQCLEQAGIAYVPEEEDTARRANHLQLRPIAGQKRPGGSSWQSLRRAVGSIEADYLNGEIVLLGRAHGVATPVNELLQLLAAQMARLKKPPATMTVAELEAMWHSRAGSGA